MQGAQQKENTQAVSLKEGSKPKENTTLSVYMAYLQVFLQVFGARLLN